MGKFDGVLMVSDLDGTLLTSNQRISERNREAIKHFTDEGGIFTYITGRILAGARPILRQFAPDAPIGCINGGGLYDLKTDRYVWTTPLDPSAEELVGFVCREFPDAGVELCGFHGAWFHKINHLTEEHRLLEETELISAPYGEVAHDIGKILVIIEPDRLQAVAEALAKHPLADRFTMVSSWKSYYEILPKEVSKGNGLLRLAELLKIDPARTVAVGDNDNDLTMLQAAGYGVAVANATPAAREGADLVLDHTNDEDAIAELIERLERELPF